MRGRMRVAFWWLAGRRFEPRRTATLVSGAAPIRLLALSPIPEEGAGCRFRSRAVHPATLHRFGIDVTLRSLFNAEFFDLV